MVAYWLSGTPPRNTSVSVPRLTPVRRVRTSTSSGPGSGTQRGRISQAIQSANANQGLGTITADNRDINLRAPSMLQTPQDIARVQITGTPYRVGDVATIEDGVADVEGYSRLDGREDR